MLLARGTNDSGEWKLEGAEIMTKTHLTPRNLVVTFYKGLENVISQSNDKARLVFRLIFLLRNTKVCLFRSE
jgi:hypothetical protein